MSNSKLAKKVVKVVEPVPEPANPQAIETVAVGDRIYRSIMGYVRTMEKGHLSFRLQDATQYTNMLNADNIKAGEKSYVTYNQMVKGFSFKAKPAPETEHLLDTLLPKSWYLVTYQAHPWSAETEDMDVTVGHYATVLGWEQVRDPRAA